MFLIFIVFNHFITNNLIIQIKFCSGIEHLYLISLDSISLRLIRLISMTNQINDDKTKILLSTSQLDHKSTLNDEYKELADREKERADEEKERADKEKERGDREKNRADEYKELGEQELQRIEREIQRIQEKMERAGKETKRLKNEIERFNRSEKSYITQMKYFYFRFYRDFYYCNLIFIDIFKYTSPH